MGSDGECRVELLAPKIKQNKIKHDNVSVSL